jgi:2-dehydro-3-deoxyphosphogluconate aldolase/(4S)-4-hydroxy-2-oxoglutarate aldolase
VNLDTAADFVRAGAVGLGVGSSLVNQKLLDAGDYDEITSRARRFREAFAAGKE